MTTFRILPNGARRRLPDGSVRALGANGPRYADVSGSVDAGVGAAAGVTARVPAVGQTLLWISMSGTMDFAGNYGVTSLSIPVTASLTATASMTGSAVASILTTGGLSAAIPMGGSTYIRSALTGRLSRAIPISGSASAKLLATGALAVAGVLSGAASAKATVTGVLVPKAAGNWQELWRNVYDKRQKVLNAIDANNRALAKAAGTQATATANALVTTNSRVTTTENSITAVASRVTLVEAAIPNKADASALLSLQATVTSQGNLITSQSSVITAVSASANRQRVFMQATAPDAATQGPFIVGDEWVDTGDQNRRRMWTGTTWTAMGDTRIGSTASAVTTLTAEVNSLGQARATWGVYLDVNGRISGLQSINNGVVSEFKVLADVFELLSPGAADGLEVKQGYIRVWKGSSQTIIGHSFGVSGQKLVRWFGPNIGAEACTKANATIWEDSDGNAYFGGQVLQGVLRFFNSNTTVGNTASVETGQNASNGKVVAVQARVAIDNLQQYPNFTSFITLGAGTTSAVVAIERMYQGGAWVELIRRTIIGQAGVNNESDGPSTIQWTIDGSVLFTDAASTASRNYRARVISVSFQSYSVSNPGTTPAAIRNQYQSIESME